MDITAPTAFQFQKSGKTADTINEKQLTQNIENKRLDTACKDFEALLLNKIMTSMRESLPEGGLFEKSYGEEIFQSMLDEQMTKEMAHGKGMGLAKLLYQDLNAPELSPADRKIF